MLFIRPNFKKLRRNLRKGILKGVYWILIGLWVGISYEFCVVLLRDFFYYTLRTCSRTADHIHHGLLRCCAAVKISYIKYRNEGSSGAWFTRSELFMQYCHLGAIIIAGTCHEGRWRKNCYPCDSKRSTGGAHLKE